MIFLDIESDNPDPRAEPDPASDSIVSIAVVGEGLSLERFVNPGFPLTRTGIHGITDEMVAEQPPFQEIAHKLLKFLQHHVYIVTYNGARYDIPLLWEEFHRSEVDWQTEDHQFIDLAILWRKMEPRSLSDAVRCFAGCEHKNAHSALADAAVLPAVLDGMRRRLGVEAEFDDAKLAELSTPTMKIGRAELPLIDLGGMLARAEDGRAVYTHKKNRGIAVEDDPGYGYWLLRQRWLGENSRLAIERALREEAIDDDARFPGGLQGART